jgi:purine nucleosidase
MVGSRACTLHDPLAAAITLDPDLATYRQLALEVELRATHTRGQVLADLRQISSNAHIGSTIAQGRNLVKVAETVDAARFLSRMLATLTEQPLR